VVYMLHIVNDGTYTVVYMLHIVNDGTYTVVYMLHIVNDGTYTVVYMLHIVNELLMTGLLRAGALADSVIAGLQDQVQLLGLGVHLTLGSNLIHRVLNNTAVILQNYTTQPNGI
jgi:hypothetical protein